MALPTDPSHPFLSHLPRHSRHFKLTAWAVVMDTRGHQIPHIHSASRLSGIYYVKVPRIVAAPGNGQHGWVEFGRATKDFRCVVEPEVRAFQPEEGLMLTFPFYFYHRTIPFESEEKRVSIAFDIIAVRHQNIWDN